MTSLRCCARSAAISSASARGSTSSPSSSSARSSAPSGVPPGSNVNTAPRRVASKRAWVDLPEPSPPSNAISTHVRLPCRRHRSNHDQACDEDDERRRVQRQPDAWHEELLAAGQCDGAAGEQPSGDAVEKLGQEGPERERDEQAQANDRVQRAEDAAPQLV